MLENDVSVLGDIVVYLSRSTSYRFDVAVSSEIVECVGSVDSDRRLKANKYVEMHTSILVEFSSNEEAHNRSKVLLHRHKEISSIVNESTLDICVDLRKSKNEC